METLHAWQEVARPGDRILVGLPVGLALAEAIGLAWAARRHGDGAVVHVLVSSAELATSLPVDLTALAVRERLGNLQVVVHAGELDTRAEDHLHELAARGFTTDTASAHARGPIAASMRRARSASRPSVLTVLGAGEIEPPADRLRAPAPGRRTPIEIPFALDARSLGGFAVGVALHGAYAPVCTLPLHDAFAATAALRHAAALRLPIVFNFAESGDEPLDALPTLRLLSALLGLDVSRNGAVGPVVSRPWQSTAAMT